MRPVPRFLLAVVVAGWAATGPAAAQSDPVGTAAATRGEVVVHRDAGTQSLDVGAPVYVGDRIVTGANGRVALAMNDGAEIAVGPETELVVANYVVEGGNRESGVWDLLRGILRATLPQSGTPAPFDVETGVAIASARSTEFAVEADDDKTAVLSIEGRVEVTMVDGTAGALLVPGFGVDLTPGQPPTGPRQWPPERVRSFIDRTTVR